MTNWNNDLYEWVFSDAGISNDTGANITGSNIFRGNAFYTMTKEMVQNVTDAKDDRLPEDLPVVARFEVVYIEAKDIPGMNRLRDVIKKCRNYIMDELGSDEGDVQRLYEASLKYFQDNSKIPALKIGDRNTVGLDRINFVSLLRNDGLTPKTGDSNGSFGFGKYAAFILSDLHTVLYSSKTRDGEILFQAKSFLSTFRDDDGRKKMNMTLFGENIDNGSDCKPVTNIDDIPEVYRREDNGTDIYIVGFKDNEDWKNLIILASIENFFYAIDKGTLIIEVADGNETITIDKTTLPMLIDEFEGYYNEHYSDNTEDITFSAPVYWRMMKDPGSEYVIDEDFMGKGLVELYFAMGQTDVGKSVLEMRKSGMRIREERFNRIPDFCGVLIASGNGKDNEDENNNISKFLRDLETPTHSTWSAADAKKVDRKEADKLLKKLTKFIRDSVKEKIVVDAANSVEAFGLNKFLSDETEDGVDKLNEAAFNKFVPVPIMSSETKKSLVKKDIKKKVNGRGKKPADNPTPKPDPDEKRERKNVNNKQREKIVAKSIHLSNVRAPFSTDDKKYRISFVPEEDAKELMVKIKIGGDDSQEFDAIPVNAEINGKRLKMDGEYVLIPNVKKNEKVQLFLKMQDDERYALEVTAYAKQ